MNTLYPLLVNGLLEGSRIGIAGLGFALIFFTTRELHFAYGAALAGAGYLFFQLFGRLAWPGWLTVVVVLAASAAGGVAVKVVLYRPLRDHLAILLFSFGLAIVLENVYHVVFGPSDVLPPITFLDRVAELPGPGLTLVRYIDFAGFAAFVVATALLLVVLERSRVGAAIQAVMRDEGMARLVGIRTGQIAVLVYATGSLLGGISGIVHVTRTGVRPDSGFEVVLFAFIVTLLAVGRIGRVALWALVIGVVRALVAWRLPTELSTLLVFVAMLAYLVARAPSPGRRRLQARPVVATGSPS